MDEISSLFGVSIGEEFKIRGYPGIYQFLRCGLVCRYDSRHEWEIVPYTMHALFTGVFEIEKRPCFSHNNFIRSRFEKCV